MSLVAKNPTATDWARLAAFIDGEGSIFLRNEDVRGRRRTYLYVNVSNTDMRLMGWLKENFGGCITSMDYEGKPAQWSKCYQWVIAHAKATAILEGCYPYFIIKRDQAEVALAHQRLVAKVKAVAGVHKAAIADETNAERQEMRIELSRLKTRGRVVPLATHDLIQ